MRAMLELVRRHKSGTPVGVYSVCSAHPMVLEAALRLARRTGGVALIEATSNQVNQDGGYTGMRPATFRERVHALANDVGLPHDQVVLGGDHLGPNCWQGLPSATALNKAGVMVAEYVAAGFRKIHLDCSMSCADDPRTLGDELIAERTAALCEITEATWRSTGGEPPVYIIGSEVPVPGGAHETLQELAVTTPEAARATIEAHRRSFARHGVEAAWGRVVGLVVQPGVEFDHHRVIDYVRSKAVTLSRSIEPVAGMVFEAHSTDYQTPAALEALVQDHFAILKVGPGVTFALREALWALSDIALEMDLMPDATLKDAMIEEMRREPRYWSAYYLDCERQDFDIQFSLSDRIRYYWNAPAVERVCARLLECLSAEGLPLTLISQYLPLQYAAIREGRLKNDPRELVLDGIEQVLRHYDRACRPAGPAGNTVIDRGRA
ncbi:MAG TPA: D-tagatose-bisphosphate aldolase, class II, non-catalytic subunit [Steroidobacteraceae bacterium]|nr:D-tagatose-bisphosphate aldolase, class II, non-catalytic subunit [Steroidobacteraceae bacterium]